MNMLYIIFQGLLFLSLLVVFLYLSDTEKRDYVAKIKMFLVVVSAASVLRFGRNIYVILVVIMVGIIVLAKRNKNKKDASLDIG